MYESGPWAIKILMGTARKQRVDTGHYRILYKGENTGYYNRDEGGVVFITKRPRLLTEHQSDELAHLVRSIDEAEDKKSERTIVFARGIRPSPFDKIKTPARSRIVLPEDITSES